MPLVSLSVSASHSPNGSAIRADKFLANAYPAISRTRLQKLFDDEHVLLDGEVIVKSHMLSAGDTIEFPHPDTLSRPLEPRKVNFDVLYEDAALLIINKPAGIAVHPVSLDDEQTTIANGILYYLGEAAVKSLTPSKKDSIEGQKLKDAAIAKARKIGPDGRHCIVHRLDKDTTGVLILAKTIKSFDTLKEMFAARRVTKEYLAIVRGCPDLLGGSINEPIGRSPRNPLKMIIREDGRESRTDWERVAVDAKANIALVRCYLHTGRTHQARVHLSHLGYPVLGDTAYGYRGTYAGRPLLHAYRIRLEHPTLNKQLEIIAPVPGDMREWKGLFTR